jgi:hypothetical protein
LEKLTSDSARKIEALEEELKMQWEKTEIRIKEGENSLQIAKKQFFAAQKAQESLRQEVGTLQQQLDAARDEKKSLERDLASTMQRVTDMSAENLSIHGIVDELELSIASEKKGSIEKRKRVWELEREKQAWMSQSSPSINNSSASQLDFGGSPSLFSPQESPAAGIQSPVEVARQMGEMKVGELQNELQMQESRHAEEMAQAKASIAAIEEKYRKLQRRLYLRDSTA